MGNQQAVNTDIIIKEKVKHGSTVMKRQSASSASSNGSINLKTISQNRKSSLFSSNSNDAPKRSSSLETQITPTVDKINIARRKSSYEKKKKKVVQQTELQMNNTDTLLYKGRLLYNYFNEKETQGIPRFSIESERNMKGKERS